VIVFFGPPAQRQLKQIVDELAGIREETKRIADALTTQPAREIAAVEWHTDVPTEEP
jgi:hypothetical protein